MDRAVKKAGMLRKTSAFAVLAVFLVLTGACRNPAQTMIPTGLGRLELNLGNLARSVLPIYDYAYTMDFYQITGTGPDGAYFEVAEFSGTLYSIIGLEPGIWEVSITARNAMKEVIAGTSLLTTILADQTTTANPIFTRLDGTGYMDLSLRWYVPWEYIAAEARLEGADSQTVMLDQTQWTITETGATFPVSPLRPSLPAGSYTLILSLWKNGQDPASEAPAYSSETPVPVEIYNGYTSKGVFTIATWAASQDFLYHPDRPVYAVEFGSETKQKLTIRGAAGSQLYLVKVNPTGTKVNAQATGSAFSNWEYLANSASASEPTIDSHPRMELPVRREHEAALLFNANPPPLPAEPPARSLDRTITYGTTPPDYIEGTTQKYFWVENSSGIFVSIPATLRAIGRYTYVWVAKAAPDSGFTIDWNNLITDDQVGTIRDKFDGTLAKENKDGIFRNVSTIFGHEYGGGNGGDGGRDGDQHISILLYDIDGDYYVDQYSGILGYFWSKDFYSQDRLSSTMKTNYAEIFYLDAHFADSYPMETYSTLAHEYQHMIHFNMKKIRLGLDSGIWFNEMCSMVAEDLVLQNIGFAPADIRAYGPQARLDVFAYHYAESGVSDWLPDNEVLKSYAGAFAFGAYLARNFGGAGFFRELLHNNQVNEAAISAAMAAPGALGNGQGFSQELLRYGEALLLTPSLASEGLRSLNREVTSILPGDMARDTAGDDFIYTVLPIDLAAIKQYDLNAPSENLYGMRSYLPSQILELKPYGNSIHTQDSWAGISGELEIILEAPEDRAVHYFLILK